jgi:hypothetical protein
LKNIHDSDHVMLLEEEGRRPRGASLSRDMPALVQRATQASNAQAGTHSQAGTGSTLNHKTTYVPEIQRDDSTLEEFDEANGAIESDYVQLWHPAAVATAAEGPVQPSATKSPAHLQEVPTIIPASHTHRLEHAASALGQRLPQSLRRRSRWLPGVQDNSQLRPSVRKGLTPAWMCVPPSIGTSAAHGTAWRAQLTRVLVLSLALFAVAWRLFRAHARLPVHPPRSGVDIGASWPPRCVAHDAQCLQRTCTLVSAAASRDDAGGGLVAEHVKAFAAGVYAAAEPLPVAAAQAGSHDTLLKETLKEMHAALIALQGASFAHNGVAAGSGVACWRGYCTTCMHTALLALRGNATLARARAGIVTTRSTHKCQLSDVEPRIICSREWIVCALWCGRLPIVVALKEESSWGQ